MEKPLIYSSHPEIKSHQAAFVVNNTLNMKHDPQQLQFSGSRIPCIIVNENICVAETDSVTWVRHHKAEIESVLEDTGAILFRGFPVTSAESFDRFSAAFGYPSFTYQNSLSNAVRVNFTERVFTANEAPKHIEIFLHHEMAQTPVSPARLFFYCHSSAETGGATPLCRSDMLYEKFLSLKPDWAGTFESRGLKYRTLMPSENDPSSGQGRSPSVLRTGLRPS